MNKIVREHYPASKLPEELRGGIDPERRVTVTILVEDAVAFGSDHLRQLLDHAHASGGADPADREYSPAEMQKRIEGLHASGSVKPISIEEAVARIRALRDEWDE